MSPSLPGISLAHPELLPALPDASRIVVGTARPVAGATRCSHINLKPAALDQYTLRFNQPGILVLQLPEAPRGKNTFWWLTCFDISFWHADFQLSDNRPLLLAIDLGSGGAVGMWWIGYNKGCWELRDWLGTGDSQSWDDAVHGVCSTLSMLYVVNAALGVNSWSWPGEIERDYLASCS